MNINQKKIEIGMSESERYEILRNRFISVPKYDSEKLFQINDDDYSALEQVGKGEAYKVLRKIGEDFGVFREDYTTQDVEFEFAFSRRALHESVYRQKGEFRNYIQMMTILDEVIANAVGIDMHSDRYNNTQSPFDAMYVFVSAFIGDGSIVPVLLKVKTYIDETAPLLYVAVSLQEIERSRIVGYTPDAESTKSYPIPASDTVSLAEILSSVNIEDGNLLKYIPDGFLDDKQKEAKRIALLETEEYIAKRNARRSGQGTSPDESKVGERTVDYARDAMIIYKSTGYKVG